MRNNTNTHFFLMENMQCPLSMDSNGTFQELSGGRCRSCRGNSWAVLDLGSRVASGSLSDKLSLSGLGAVSKAIRESFLGLFSFPKPFSPFFPSFLKPNFQEFSRCPMVRTLRFCTAGRMGLSPVQESQRHTVRPKQIKPNFYPLNLPCEETF